MLLPLLLLGACDQLPDLGSLFGEEPPPAPVAPPPKDAAAQLEDARALLRGGKAKEALAAAEAVLGASPDQDAAWDLAEIAALRSGAAAEMVDRLSADQAIGGRADRHHALRGVLAVEANRLGDALNSAKALETTSPGDAAVIAAMAVAKGAPATGISAAATALVAAKDPNVPLDPQVAALPGWRAALYRGQLELARGDRAAAAKDASAAAAGGAVARSRAAALAAAAASPDEVWAVVEPAARKALEDGEPSAIAEILDAGRPAAARAWKAAELAGLATELRGKLTELGNTLDAARVAAVEADAALRAGQPVRARDAAQIAAAEPTLAVRAGWSLVLARAALGDPAGIDAAAATLAEPRAGAAKRLAGVLRGQGGTLPSEGLVGEEAALQALLGAGWLADPAPALAAAAAAAPEDTDLVLWARLAGGRSPDAVEPSTPAAAAEKAARQIVAGQTASVPGDAGHPALAAWAAVAGGALSTEPGVAAWARARAAIAAGDGALAADELASLATASPSWRTGPWDPLLALDGPGPSAVEALAADNAKGKDPVPFAVVHHGWASRYDGLRRMWQAGVSPLAGSVPADKRAAVWDAVATRRQGVLAWIAGKGPWPTEADQKLVAAEKAAGLGTGAPPRLAEVRKALDGDAVLSFRAGSAGVEALYLTEEKGKVVTLSARAGDELRAFASALASGNPDVVQGDRVREAIIDPGMDVLLGEGKYVLVGMPGWGVMPVSALPEQAEGLRFLAAIRHVTFVSDFDGLLPAPSRAEPAITMVAFCADSTDAAVIRRVYPDAVVLEGKDATLAAWREKAPQARFLSVGNFPVVPGGLQLADGVLSAAEIGGTSLSAAVASFRSASEPERIWDLGSAARRAGAQDVLLEAWADNAAFRESVHTHFWEGVNRRYTAARALSEARTLAIREEGETARLPNRWAGWFVAGRP